MLGTNKKLPGFEPTPNNGLQLAQNITVCWSVTIPLFHLFCSTRYWEPILKEPVMELKLFGTDIVENVKLFKYVICLSSYCSLIYLYFYRKSFTYLEPVIFVLLVLSYLFYVLPKYIMSTPAVNNVFMSVEIFHIRISKHKNSYN